MIAGADLLACIVAWSMAAGLSWLGQPVAAGGGEGVAAAFASTSQSIAVSAAALLYFVCNNHYRQRRPFWSEVRDLASVAFVSAATGVGLIMSGATRSSSLPLLAAWVTFPFAAIALRNLTRRQLERLGLWRRRVVVVGDRDAAVAAISALHSDRTLGLQIVDVVEAPADPDRFDAAEWKTLLRQREASMLVLALAGSSRTTGIIAELLHEAVPFAVLHDVGDLPSFTCEPTRFASHDAILMQYRKQPVRRAERVAKVIVDLVAASSLLIFLLPLMLLIAGLIRLDGGPVFFSQVRIGANGKRFRCFKFRSMKVDSERLLRELLANDPDAAREWAENHKLRNDPRVTGVGAFLRRTSLDELPQLLNVMRLEMSLVGPRPIGEREIMRYGTDIAFYYQARPGLTGLWQVSGRSDTTYKQRVQFDTSYVKNWTIWADMAILFKTVPAVLLHRGAV